MLSGALIAAWVTSAVALAGPLPDLTAPLRTGAQRPQDAAVVVGNERYAFVADVPAARQDAQLAASLLVYTLGVPGERVTVLDDGASREDILAAVQASADIVGDGGTLWFFYAGHGAASPETGQQLLLGDDVRARAGSLPARGLAVEEVVQVAQGSGTRAVLVLDTCYTGVGRDGAELLPGQRMLVPDHALVPDGEVLIWNAASPGQTSAPLPRVEQGAFTWYVVGALRGWADGELDGLLDGQVTAAEAQAYVARQLAAHSELVQRPTLAGSEPEAQVLSTGAREADPFESWRALRSLEGGEALVRAGSRRWLPTVAAGPVAGPVVYSHPIAPGASAAADRALVGSRLELGAALRLGPRGRATLGLGLWGAARDTDGLSQATRSELDGLGVSTRDSITVATGSLGLQAQGRRWSIGVGALGAAGGARDLDRTGAGGQVELWTQDRVLLLGGAQTRLGWAIRLRSRPLSVGLALDAGALAGPSLITAWGGLVLTTRVIPGRS